MIPLDDLWEAYRRVCKPSAAIVLTACQPFTSKLVMSNPRVFRFEYIWRKNVGSNFLNARHQPMREHESVLVFYAERPTYNPQRQARSAAGQKMVRANVKTTVTGGEVYRAGLKSKDMTGYDPETRGPSSVQDFGCERGFHPTQKPVSLMRYMIRTFSNPGDLVLDNTMGSGSTGVAAMVEGRGFVGIEQDAGYYAIAERRIGEVAEKSGGASQAIVP